MEKASEEYHSGLEESDEDRFARLFYKTQGGDDMTEADWDDLAGLASKMGFDERVLLTHFSEAGITGDSRAGSISEAVRLARQSGHGELATGDIESARVGLTSDLEKTGPDYAWRLFKDRSPKRVAQRWNGQPVNMKTATLQEITEGAQSRVMAPDGERPEWIVWGNRQATRLLENSVAKLPHASRENERISFTGVHMYPEQVESVTRDLRNTALSGILTDKAADAYLALDYNIETVFVRNGRQSIGYADADDTRTDEEVRRTEMHELGVHVSQARIAEAAAKPGAGQVGAYLTSSEWMKADPDYEQIANSKIGRRYAKKPQLLAHEAIASIASGAWGLMGYTGRDGLERAAAFADRYFRGVARNYGVSEVMRFRYIHPEFKQTVERIINEEGQQRGRPGESWESNPLYTERGRSESGTGPRVRGIEQSRGGRNAHARAGGGGHGEGLGGRLPERWGGGGAQSSRGIPETSESRGGRGTEFAVIGARGFEDVKDERGANVKEFRQLNGASLFSIATPESVEGSENRRAELPKGTRQMTKENFEGPKTDRDILYIHVGDRPVEVFKNPTSTEYAEIDNKKADNAGKSAGEMIAALRTIASIIDSNPSSRPWKALVMEAGAVASEAIARVNVAASTLDDEAVAALGKIAGIKIMEYEGRMLSDKDRVEKAVEIASRAIDNIVSREHSRSFDVNAAQMNQDNDSYDQGMGL